MEKTKMAGYLFVHFVGEEKNGEQIYFSLSRDGLHWKDLNDKNPVLYSRTGTCGVRDPFLVRDPESRIFYLIATDLRIEAGHGWQKAQYEGSRDLIVWESEDLIHWSKERSCTVGIDGAGCVWAPEAVYDREKGEFLVFFASMGKAAGEKVAKQRIYAAYTKDFRRFSDTFLYMERENHVIDTTILEWKEHFYRVSKDEVTKRLMLEVSDSLLGEFKQIDSPVLSALEGVEGPEGYLLPDGKTWCLIADQFQAGRGYLPMISEDLASGKLEILTPDQYDMGETKKRHGGVLQITDEEYERLLYWFDRKNPVLDGLYADPDLWFEDGMYYLYPTTDGYPHWSGNEFYVFTSGDGKQFAKKARILDVASEEVPWAAGSAWAPCITKKNDQYYFYFCAKNKEGVSCIGAAVSKSPAGPFTAMDTPLVTLEMVREKGIEMAQTIDPSVYREGEDYYLILGNTAAAVAKLSEDLLHIEEDSLRQIEGLEDFREALTVFKRKGRYHFTWSCDDTGSEDYHVNYGVSDSLWGPVTFIGTVLSKEPCKDILGTGHHCILKMPGEDRYLIAYHRFARPLADYTEGKGWHREVCIAPLAFDQDGFLMPVITN